MKEWQLMTAKFPYLNKLEDKYNNAYYHSINKKSINVNFFPFTEKNWEES